jgi:hypothetical protein
MFNGKVLAVVDIHNENVKKDFEMYNPLVGGDGIIAFYDIVQGSPKDVSMPKLWSEIKHKFNYIEIVKIWKHGECGIDVIYL